MRVEMFLFIQGRLRPTLMEALALARRVNASPRICRPRIQLRLSKSTIQQQNNKHNKQTMPHRASPTLNSKAERARQFLRTGGVLREDSDDELGLDDHPWEWIYASATDDDETEADQIIGARMGDFQCAIGDCCLLKAEGTNEAWVGIICSFEEEDAEDGGKSAEFMWFSTDKEIRNKQKKRTDALPVGF